MVFTGTCVKSQTEKARWTAVDVPYELKITHHHEYAVDYSSLGMTLISLTRNLYYFLVSDLDGDNCPFFPTCSSFFVQAVSATNIITGSLMFADRFTRDLNFLKGKKQYPEIKNGKYFDPPSNYILDSDRKEIAPPPNR
jgi:putative component of membrane protein insertase Oxa1/YidC/SpoIIIJ protein YidD